MLSLTPALIAAKNAENDGDSIWTFLFHIQVDATDHLFLAAHDEKVTFQTKVYIPYPIELNELQDDSEGNLNDVTVTLAAPPGQVAKMIDDAKGLRGATVTIHAVSLDYLAQPISETYEVTDCNTNRLGASLRLGFINLLAVELPRRVYTVADFPAIQT
jgi:phage-related protein